MSNFIYPSFTEEKSNQKFSDLRTRVSLLNEPRCYNYLGTVIELQLESIADRDSADYAYLIAIYKVFLQNFSEINEGASWKSSLNLSEQ
jgi:hypothetical protein